MTKILIKWNNKAYIIFYYLFQLNYLELHAIYLMNFIDSFKYFWTRNYPIKILQIENYIF